MTGRAITRQRLSGAASGDDLKDWRLCGTLSRGGPGGLWHGGGRSYVIPISRSTEHCGAGPTSSRMTPASEEIGCREFGGTAMHRRRSVQAFAVAAPVFGGITAAAYAAQISSGWSLSGTSNYGVSKRVPSSESSDRYLPADNYGYMRYTTSTSCGRKECRHELQLMRNRTAYPNQEIRRVSASNLRVYVNPQSGRSWDAGRFHFDIAQPTMGSPISLELFTHTTSPVT